MLAKVADVVRRFVLVLASAHGADVVDDALTVAQRHRGEEAALPGRRVLRRRVNPRKERLGARARRPRRKRRAILLAQLRGHGRGPRVVVRVRHVGRPQLGRPRPRRRGRRLLVAARAVALLRRRRRGGLTPLRLTLLNKAKQRPPLAFLEVPAIRARAAAPSRCVAEPLLAALPLLLPPSAGQSAGGQELPPLQPAHDVLK